MTYAPTRLNAVIRWIGPAACAICILAGILVLIGWATRSDLLKSLSIRPADVDDTSVKLRLRDRQRDRALGRDEMHRIGNASAEPWLVAHDNAIRSRLLTVSKNRVERQNDRIGDDEVLGSE